MGVISLWPIGAMLAVGVIVACLPRLRRACVDAGRCTARYPALWRIPAFFAAAYGLFGIASTVLLKYRIDGELPPLLAIDHRFTVQDLAPFSASLLPATEQVAALLNCLPTPFPLSALAALLFLSNRYSSATAVWRTSRRRLGRGGPYFFFAILLGAVAALLRPFYTLALPEISTLVPWSVLLPGLTLLNAFAFVFDYLFATGVQLYLIFTAWAWLRGTQFHAARLIRFSARRLGSLIVWPLIIIGATLALVHLPLLVQAFAFSEMNWQTDALARPAWALFLLALPAVQISLALRHQGLRQALLANAEFLRGHGFSYLVFIAGAWLIALTLHLAGLTAWQYLGDSLLGLASVAACQALTAGLAGWQLTVWVCFFTRPREVDF